MKQNETWSSSTAQSKKKCRMACFLYFLVLEKQMDTLDVEPRTFRMRSGHDTATPCALGIKKIWILVSFVLLLLLLLLVLLLLLLLLPIGSPRLGTD